MPFWAGIGAFREFGGSHDACADQRENVELDRSLKRCSALITVQGIEDQEGIRFVSGSCRALCGHRLLS
jgi:hypothetical protein